MPQNDAISAEYKRGFTDALERCATVCDELFDDAAGTHPEYYQACLACAAAIRALKPAATQGEEG